MIRKDCINKMENKYDCPCPDNDCERHGICYECIKYHKNKKNTPVCLRKLG